MHRVLEVVERRRFPDVPRDSYPYSRLKQSIQRQRPLNLIVMQFVQLVHLQQYPPSGTPKGLYDKAQGKRSATHETPASVFVGQGALGLL